MWITCLLQHWQLLNYVRQAKSSTHVCMTWYIRKQLPSVSGTIFFESLLSSMWSSHQISSLTSSKLQSRHLATSSDLYNETWVQDLQGVHAKWLQTQVLGYERKRKSCVEVPSHDCMTQQLTITEIKTLVLGKPCQSMLSAEQASAEIFRFIAMVYGDHIRPPLSYLSIRDKIRQKVAGERPIANPVRKTTFLASHHRLIHEWKWVSCSHF